MKFIRYALASILAAAALTAAAAVPTGYYNSLNGKSEGELKTAVYTLTHNFTRVSSYSALPSYFQQTDVYPDSRRWWDMYSDIPLYAPSFSGLNREHSFPKSWWGGSTSVGAYVDLNHLYPSEMKANTAKSNYPLGVVDRTKSLKFDNGICAVGNPVRSQGGGAPYVFEPDDEYKGDFARTYFYMATTYQDLTWRYTFMVSQNLYPTLNPWSVELLLDWHRQDPVSQKEIDRNEAVYRIQNNRNPFIDMPELAEYIWGEKKGEKFTPGSVPVTPVGDPELVAPLKDMEIQFGEVAQGNTATMKIFVQAKNITGSIAVTIYSGDKDMFVSTENKIPAQLACTETGYWLTVTYRPTALGTHSTRILFENSGFGSRGVSLRGECLPVPALGACTATDATDIQADRYTANWTAPSGDVIDYFQVTRTRYVGSQVFTETLVAEDNYLEIVGFDESDSEAYSVQSVRLGVLSPMSNVVFVTHAGITGVDAEEPLLVYGYEGFLRFDCLRQQSDARIYDTMGREVALLPAVDDGMEVELPAGIYLVVTAQHPAPVKVVVK